MWLGNNYLFTCHELLNGCRGDLFSHRYSHFLIPEYGIAFNTDHYYTSLVTSVFRFWFKVAHQQQLVFY
jgi:hypothetical protein